MGFLTCRFAGRAIPLGLLAGCWTTLFGMSFAMAQTREVGPSAEKGNYAIALHGGAISRADRFSDAERAAREASLRRALLVGRDLLASGGSALDAVEQTIRLLEDDPLFNAGKGAVFNADGTHELDASIMDGRDKSCGAVAGVKAVKNPISLARLVMTRTRHVLLAGDGADRFAEEMGVERVENRYFSTPEARAEWNRVRAARAASPNENSKDAIRRDKVPDSPARNHGGSGPHMGTVGCVARDQHGNLAAGTSTGGLTDKRYGRVGDSPIIGAGTYADNETCAVSCTGIGEHFIRHAVAHEVSSLVAYRKLDLAAAMRLVLQERLPNGAGGIIAVDSHGNLVADYNTAGLSRALADSTGRVEVVVGK